MQVKNNAIFTTHDWEWFIPHKNSDDWGMVYSCFIQINGCRLIMIINYHDIAM
jgi:hypothetical protein